MASQRKGQIVRTWADNLQRSDGTDAYRPTCTSDVCRHLQRQIRRRIEIGSLMPHDLFLSEQSRLAKVGNFQHLLIGIENAIQRLQVTVCIKDRRGQLVHSPLATMETRWRE